MGLFSAITAKIRGGLAKTREVFVAGLKSLLLGRTLDEATIAEIRRRLIEADVGGYLRSVMGSRHAGMAPFDPRALAEYERALSQPGAAHALCEDYRAAAGIDLEHDREDRQRGTRLAMPLLALWGANGIVQRCFDPLAEWGKVADDVRGQALPCGHYIPEEAPQALLQAIEPFLGAA